MPVSANGDRPGVPPVGAVGGIEGVEHRHGVRHGIEAEDRAAQSRPAAARRAAVEEAVDVERERPDRGVSFGFGELVHDDHRPRAPDRSDRSRRARRDSRRTPSRRDARPGPSASGPFGAPCRRRRSIGEVVPRRHGAGRGVDLKQRSQPIVAGTGLRHAVQLPAGLDQPAERRPAFVRAREHVQRVGLERGGDPGGRPRRARRSCSTFRTATRRTPGPGDRRGAAVPDSP